MRRKNNTKKGNTKQSFNSDSRKSLEGMVNFYQKEHPKSRYSWRFPTKLWAEILGKDPSTVRRELNKGKSRQGSEEKYYYVYSAALANERSSEKAKNKGAKKLWKKNKDNQIFMDGMALLIETLSRKKQLKKEEGFYSIYAAIIVVQRQIPEFKISESTVRNYLFSNELDGLTFEDIRIAKRRHNQDHEKDTTPHNIAAKAKHHMKNRPKSVDKFKSKLNFEGDTIVSKKGDTTALFSAIERETCMQFLVKMSRETAQCLHGALKKVINQLPNINTITFDNGSAMSKVPTLEKIVRKNRKGKRRRVFYADPYCSNQRARNERNHAIIRRFIGHGKLSAVSQKTVLKICDFVNDYPRRKFGGKSAREKFKEVTGIYIPPYFQ